MTHRAASLALLALVLTPGAQDPPPAAWTVLYYSMGDCDLEAANVQEIQEVCEGATSDRVRIVVQLDRSDRDDEDGQYTAAEMGSLGNFSGAKRFLARAGEYEELEDLGEVNMGDPATLRDFIAWGRREFPAERTALVLASHGTGWAFGGDESDDEDALTLEELREAISGGCEDSGTDAVDLLFFNCCLMGTLDTMEWVRPCADVMVSSDTTVALTIDMGASVRALSADPDLGPADWGRILCDNYAAVWEGYDDQRVLTMQVIDLSRIEAVTEAARGLSERLTEFLAEEGDDGWYRMADALWEAGGDSVDLYTVAESLAACDAEEEAAALQEAIDSAVVYRMVGEEQDGCHGIYVYFCPDAETWQGWRETYSGDAFCSEWVALIDAYNQNEDDDTDAPDVEDCDASDDELEDEEWADVTAHVDGEDLAEASFVLEAPRGDDTILLGRFPVNADDATLESHFDGTWPAIGDGQSSRLACVGEQEELSETEYRYRVSIPAQYRRTAGSAWVDVQLDWIMEWGDAGWTGAFLTAWRQTASGPTQIEIPAGGQVRPVYYRATGDGTYEACVFEEEEPLTVGEGGLRFERDDLPPGRYRVGFSVTDFAGNVDEGLTDVEVRE